MGPGVPCEKMTKAMNLTHNPAGNPRSPIMRVLPFVLAFAAFWELLEWWVTLIAASDVGQAFLGSQGDVWDAQWDMLLALIGAMLALPAFGRLHDRSMSRVPPAELRR